MIIESYLTKVAGLLPGPARARRDILAELDTGLADAADAYRESGLDARQADQAAIAEFGCPELVAAGFRAELAAAQARRMAAALMASGPVIGLLWTVAALSSRLGARLAVPWPAAPWQWAGMPAGARLAAHLFVIALVVAVAGCLVTVAVTGRLIRWLPVRGGRPAAPAACGISVAPAISAACGTALIDVALLTVLAVEVTGTPTRLAALPVAAAATASLTRFALAARAAAMITGLLRELLAPTTHDHGMAFRGAAGSILDMWVYRRFRSVWG